MADIEFSEAILDAAVLKAVEAGVFPRRASEFEAAMNREVMRTILRAAFAAAAREAAMNGISPATSGSRPRKSAGSPRLALNPSAIGHSEGRDGQHE